MANGTAEYQAYELPKGYEPTALDITSGRGKSQYNHEGNVAFRMILQDNIPRYKSSRSKSGKTLVIAGIMEELHVKGFRFIKKNPSSGIFSTIDEAEARDKVAHGLRAPCNDKSLTKKSKKKRKNEAKNKKKKKSAPPTKNIPNSILKKVYTPPLTERQILAARNRHRNSSALAGFLVDAFSRRMTAMDEVLTAGGDGLLTEETSQQQQKQQQQGENLTSSTWNDKNKKRKSAIAFMEDLQDLVDNSSDNKGKFSSPASRKSKIQSARRSTLSALNDGNLFLDDWDAMSAAIHQQQKNSGKSSIAFLDDLLDLESNDTAKSKSMSARRLTINAARKSILKRVRRSTLKDLGDRVQDPSQHQQVPPRKSAIAFLDDFGDLDNNDGHETVVNKGTPPSRRSTRLSSKSILKTQLSPRNVSAFIPEGLLQEHSTKQQLLLSQQKACFQELLRRRRSSGDSSASSANDSVSSSTSSIVSSQKNNNERKYEEDLNNLKCPPQHKRLTRRSSRTSTMLSTRRSTLKLLGDLANYKNAGQMLLDDDDDASLSSLSMSMSSLPSLGSSISTFVAPSPSAEKATTTLLNTRPNDGDSAPSAATAFPRRRRSSSSATANLAATAQLPVGSVEAADAIETQKTRSNSSTVGAKLLKGLEEVLDVHLLDGDGRGINEGVLVSKFTTLIRERSGARETK